MTFYRLVAIAVTCPVLYRVIQKNSTKFTAP